MVEVKLMSQAVSLPYTIRVYGVTDEMFDDLVDEDTKAELFDGVMIVHSPASLPHEDVSGFVGGLMRLFADARKRGKVISSGNGLVRLGPHRRLAPDTFFVRQERVPSPLPKEFPGAPNLVVEVLSLSNRDDDLE